MFFSVYTLGCKLNQLETEAITGAFSRQGFTFVPWSAPYTPAPELMVVNTCTVTSMAEQKARRFIRKLLREYPAMCLVITGCYAQVEQDTLCALEPPSGGGRRLFVVPGESKDRLLDLPRVLSEAAGEDKTDSLPALIASWFETFSSRQSRVENIDDDSAAFRLQPEDFASHSRAFLKVQDGCDRRCTYCRVSIARGKSRSLAAAEALQTLQALEKKGFAEAVIAGVNITQYRCGDLGLAELLDFLLAGTKNIRLRLSSIEPDPDWLSGSRLNDFAGVLGNSRIRPHFHLSVQSGSAEIIAKMGRAYTPQDIVNTAALLRSVRADPFLACDIIAAFPGETEKDFEKTVALCESIGFAWIHAFPFSPRPGTAAYSFGERVSDREAAQRVQRLTALAHSGRQDYIARWVGKETEAIIETGKPSTSPQGTISAIPAVSENYLKLLVACGTEPPPAPGSLVNCRILAAPPADSRYDAAAELVQINNDKHHSPPLVF